MIKLDAIFLFFGVHFFILTDYFYSTNMLYLFMLYCRQFLLHHFVQPGPVSVLLFCYTHPVFFVPSFKCSPCCFCCFFLIHYFSALNCFVSFSALLCYQQTQQSDSNTCRFVFLVDCRLLSQRKAAKGECSNVLCKRQFYPI